MHLDSLDVLETLARGVTLRLARFKKYILFLSTICTTKSHLVTKYGMVSTNDFGLLEEICPSGGSESPTAGGYAQAEGVTLPLSEHKT